MLSSCSNFDVDRDYEYANCSYGDSMDNCTLIDKLQTARDFGRSTMIFIPKLISVGTLLLNITYGFLLFLSWRRKGFRCKKNNVFLASRSYTAVLTILLLHLALFVWMFGEFNFFTTTVFLGLLMADFMFIMGTNFAHSVLLYTAVVHPFCYANFLTFHHCIVGGVVLVLFAVIQGAVVGIGSSILLFPSSNPFHFDCPIQTCQYPLSALTFAIIIGGYLLILGMYIVVMWRLCNRIDHAAKLTLRGSLFIMTGTAVPVGGIFIAMVLNMHELAALGDHSVAPCSRLEKIDGLLSLEKIIAFDTIFWLIGRTLEPILSIYTEKDVVAVIKPLTGSIRLRWTSLTTGSRQEPVHL